MTPLTGADLAILLRGAVKNFVSLLKDTSRQAKRMKSLISGYARDTTMYPSHWSCWSTAFFCNYLLCEACVLNILRFYRVSNFLSMGGEFQLVPGASLFSPEWIPDSR